MGFLKTGKTGKPLKKIIKDMGNKDYCTIEFRCKYKDRHGKIQDLSYGKCDYKSFKKKVGPMKGDLHTMDDKFIKWKEVRTKNGISLIVWEEGELMDNWSHLYKKSPFSTQIRK